MTKKDYIKMADQFRHAYKFAGMLDHKKIVLPVVEAIIRDFGTMLSQDNPHFSWEKWDKAIFSE